MSSDPVVPTETVELVLNRCLAGPATLGRGRLVSIDGPAGSGKTTLADALVRGSRGLVPSVGLLHMDDLYEGWSGLQEVTARLSDDLLRPLADGRPGHYRRWDWAAARWAERHVVDPVALLVVEGVGSGGLEVEEWHGVLVWVEAPPEVRVSRGLQRDGEHLRSLWEGWLEGEDNHFAKHKTRDRADVVVDASGRIRPSP
jgi:uridine kinase